MASTTQTIPTIPADWRRAVERSATDGLKSFRLAGTDAAGRTGYIVRSTSTDAGAFHVVWVGTSGRIEYCTNCPAQDNGHVCKHKGCVARRLIRERYGESVLQAMLKGVVFRTIRRGRPAEAAEAIEPAMETARTSRRSIYRKEAS